LDREQELIPVIQEETKRTEEKEEAGYRSPTWSILRALHKINKASKRIEGETVMSAPTFLQSAGRGDLKFLGEDFEHIELPAKLLVYFLQSNKSNINQNRPTVVIWQSLLKLEQEQWSQKQANRRIGWFSAGRGKKTKSNTCLKQMEKKSSQTAASQQMQMKERRWIRKEAKGNQCAGNRGGDRALSNAQSAKSMLRLVFHQNCHVADKENAAMKKAAGISGGKDECKVRLKGRERDY